MTIAAPPKLFTPDDLLRMPDAVNYDLVDGKLVERDMGMESSRVAARILALIAFFLRDGRQRLLFGADGSYQCFPDAPEKVRRPDVSFIRNGRLPDDRAPDGHCRIPPDLAVEVISPNDLADEVEGKVTEYLGAGIPIVWVVSPKTQTVRIHRPQTSPRGPVSRLGSDDLIDGEDILPGFSCPVRDFFA